MLTNTECCHGAAFAPIIGKPYEGKPHVRFDEGVVETGHGCPSEAPFNRKGRGTVMANLKTRRHRSTLLMRNVMARVSRREKKYFAARLKQIWEQPDKAAAEKCAQDLFREYEHRFPEAVECLKEGLEDSLQIYQFDEIDKRKLASTNPLERTNRESRRRSRVVGVFPNPQSCVRLITCFLMEYTEDWMTEKSYISRDKLQRLMERREQHLLAQPVS